MFEETFESLDEHLSLNPFIIWNQTSTTTTTATKMARTKQTARGIFGPRGGRIDPKKNFPKKKTTSTTTHRVSTTGKGTSTSLYQAAAPKPVTAPKPEVSDETDDLHDGKNILELYKETSEKEE